MRLISYNRVYTYFRPTFACILIFGKTHFDGQLLTNSIVIVCWLKWPLVPSGDKQWQILLLTTPIRDLYVHSNTTLQAQQLCREVGCLEVLAKPACMISTSSTNPSTLPNPRLLSPYTLLGIQNIIEKSIIFWILVHEKVQSPYYLMDVWSWYCKNISLAINATSLLIDFVYLGKYEHLGKQNEREMFPHTTRVYTGKTSCLSIR